MRKIPRRPGTRPVRVNAAEKNVMSRLSWNEIRVNAARFAEEWKDARYEKGETQSFYNAFFEVFGVSRRKVASFEEPVKKLNNRQGFIDLFWRKTLLVEHKSAGKNLDDAKAQALEYFVGIKDEELPRYLLLCDFQNFHLFDLDENTEARFTLAALPDFIEAFGFIIGMQKRTFRDQAPVNVAASEKMGALHDALLAAGYRGHDLERLLVRLLFCLFADDTGIFEPKDQFSDYMQECIAENGSNLGAKLGQLFDTLNEPENERQKGIDERLNAFPYINGDLFAARLRTAQFSKTMQERLLEACDFNWDAISPAIFGALFQSVMLAKERREKGAHYTTEKNILKVIEPLFLDGLRAEFKRLCDRKDNGRRVALEAFHSKIAGLRFLDPACGCGNFLIIAYRELRELELALLKELYSGEQRVTDISLLSRCNVSQFYGIEKEEFPARIAEVALWMTDHIANTRLSFAFGEVYRRIPLTAAPHIRHADALEMDWNALLPAAQCDYILGNPPFIGAKYQTPEQREQVRRVARLSGSGGSLDYVGAWFLKAAAFVNQGAAFRASGVENGVPLPNTHYLPPAGIGFVATNSITQGEQVGQLWPLLLEREGMRIDFAHTTFAWGSEARGMARVHVVIIGLSRRDDRPGERRLFSYTDIKGEPAETRHAVLSPYLTDAGQLANPNLTIEEASSPLNGMPSVKIGSKPVDGGNLIFEPEERDAFLSLEPDATKFMRPYVGAEELINGKMRYILALHNATTDEIRDMPAVKERLDRVTQFRAESKSASTIAIAALPAMYHVNVLPELPYLAIPKVSSERREYVPIAYLEPPIIPSDLVFVVQNAEKWHFALLTSRMHMAWMRAIGGRLESRYRYSIGVVYNNFPLPPLDAKSKERLTKLAEAVLDARSEQPTATLADLYDKIAMPASLRKAHIALDKVVDKLYRAAPFPSDRDRVEFLLAEYEKLSAPLLALAADKKQKRRKS